MINPGTYGSLAGSLILAGEEVTLQVGDSLRRLHVSTIKNPNNIIAAGKAFTASNKMSLSAWNTKWNAWADDDLAEAYLRGVSHADAEVSSLGLKKGEGKITSGTTLAGKDAVLAGTKGISSSVKSAFSRAGLSHHLTFYNTFKEEAVSLLGRTDLQMLRTTKDLYRDVAVMAGEASFKEADIFTRRALSQTMLDDYARRGITSVVYKNGARVGIDAYAEMVGRTMSGHTAVQASLNRYAEYGYNLVRVSSHFQACELCSPWEGKILKTGTGRVPKDPKTGVAQVFDGYLSDAISAGLFHPNCRHDVNPYFPGVSPDKLEPRVDPATQKLIDEHGYLPAQKMTYRAEQKQRYIERNIKTWKRREMSRLNTTDRMKAHRKVLDWQASQRGHIKQNPFLRRKYEREGMKGWSRMGEGVEMKVAHPIEKSLTEVYGVTTKYTGIADAEVVLQIDQALVRFIDDFSYLKDELINVKLMPEETMSRAAAQMETWGRGAQRKAEMTLNDSLFSKNIEGIKAYHANAVRMNMNPKGTDWTHIIYHEATHGALRKVEQKYGVDILKKIKRDALKAVELTAKETGRNLSAYAAANAEEFIAEGIGEYFASAAPRPLAKEIYKIVKTYVTGAGG